MKKLGKELDPVKAFSLSMVAVEQIPPEARDFAREHCLKYLVKAVQRDVAKRRACRDTDVAAATHVRPWLVA